MSWPSGRRTAEWLAFGTLGAIAHFILWQISDPRDLFSDFYKAYYPTAELLLHEGAKPTWLIPGETELGFVNIPIFAWLFVPLAYLSATSASWVFLAVGVGATATALILLCRVARNGKSVGPLLLFFFLANGPLVYSLREGNVTQFVLLFLLIALMLWNSRMEFAAGLAVGACAAMKLPLMLYAVYFLIRLRWQAIAGMATAIGAVASLSLAVFGIDINVGWYENCVSPFLGRILPAYNVQSIDGFLMRLTTGYDYLLSWDPGEPTLAHRLVRIPILAGLAAGAFYLLRGSGAAGYSVAGKKRLSDRDLLEYVFVLNLALVVSPLSWTHYYLLLLLPWGLHLGGRLPLPDDKVTRWLMGCGLLLSSLPVVFFHLQSARLEFWLSRTAASAWLFGGLCMLAALARGLSSAQDRQSEQPVLTS